MDSAMIAVKQPRAKLVSRDALGNSRRDRGGNAGDRECAAGFAQNAHVNRMHDQEQQRPDRGYPQQAPRNMNRNLLSPGLVAH